ncbi:hypothetical protein V1478_014845 [Vespula squamosa]|uniref:Uncharacterized protein n=1 Tax=Vespula squamosa TaxID=30214 RepID=A0ABD2A460_VESSQ
MAPAAGRSGQWLMWSHDETDYQHGACYNENGSTLFNFLLPLPAEVSRNGFVVQLRRPCIIDDDDDDDDDDDIDDDDDDDDDDHDNDEEDEDEDEEKKDERWEKYDGTGAARNFLDDIGRSGRTAGAKADAYVNAGATWIPARMIAKERGRRLGPPTVSVVERRLIVSRTVAQYLVGGAWRGHDWSPTLSL